MCLNILKHIEKFFSYLKNSPCLSICYMYYNILFPRSQVFYCIKSQEKPSFFRGFFCYNLLFFFFFLFCSLPDIYCSIRWHIVMWLISTRVASSSTATSSDGETTWINVIICTARGSTLTMCMARHFRNR